MRRRDNGRRASWATEDNKADREGSQEQYCSINAGMGWYGGGPGRKREGPNGSSKTTKQEGANWGMVSQRRRGGGVAETRADEGWGGGIWRMGQERFSWHGMS